MAGGELSIVAVAGHPRPGSRTHSVTVRAAAMLHDALLDAGLPVTPPQLIDLAELAPLLLDPRPGSRADSALVACQDAALLLMASPTFRGSYSGLAKLFLDLMPRHALEHAVAVPLMTAGIPAHRAAVDKSLRPVLTELHADVPGPGISILESELDRADEIVSSWLARYGGLLQAALAVRQRPHAGQAAAC
jgi:FMN reductase